MRNTAPILIFAYSQAKDREKRKRAKEIAIRKRKRRNALAKRLRENQANENSQVRGCAVQYSQDNISSVVPTQNQDEHSESLRRSPTSYPNRMPPSVEIPMSQEDIPKPSSDSRRSDKPFEKDYSMDSSGSGIAHVNLILLSSVKSCHTLRNTSLRLQ